jgi:hypothetical protein
LGVSTLNLEASSPGKLFNPAAAGLDWPGLVDKLPLDNPQERDPSVLLIVIYRDLNI